MSRVRMLLCASSRPAAISCAGSFTRYSRVASPAIEDVDEVPGGGSRGFLGARLVLDFANDDDDDAKPPRGVVVTGWHTRDDARLAALAAARAASLRIAMWGDLCFVF